MKKTVIRFMRPAMLLMVVLALCSIKVSASTARSAEPIPMILDSDFGSSTDDLFALMMLNHYIDDGLVDLKGVVVDREGEKNAGVVDIFNTYYGHPDIPIALERNGVKNPRCFIPYNGICDLKDAAGNPLFRRSVDTSSLPDGYKLYRRVLGEARDKSVVIVAIGFATTLAQLMESGADEYSPLDGVSLLDRKVKAIYIQSGRFESGDSLCGYNMRAASKQSAVFYDRLPASVDLVMSPSNIGDGMDYVPADVLADLSATGLNPIKAVYTNYTCDTGQRMWDTNCLVNAVLGDNEYNMSPRGWVKFVDKGEESLMLFKQDAKGNARYQLPGDSYFNQTKLMDIRRHTRITPNPAQYTIEAPQPQVTGAAAVEWAKPRVGQLVDKYMGSAGNKLDPDAVRAMLRPLGYVGLNAGDYKDVEQLLTDSIYTTMLRRAIRAGKRDVVIVTGPPASGKSTAVRALKLGGAGVVYDADLSQGDALERAIAIAKREGVEKVRVVLVYNDLMTCYANALNRGKSSYRFTGLDELVASFRGNVGRIEQIFLNYPDVEITPIDCSHNSGINKVSLGEARHWDFNVGDKQLTELFTTVLHQIDEGEVRSYEIPGVVGNVMSIGGMSEYNETLARALNVKVREYTDGQR